MRFSFQRFQHGYRKAAGSSVFVFRVARIHRNKFQPKLVAFLSRGFPSPNGDFESGKATSTRYFMNYSLAFQAEEGTPIFHDFADSVARLIEVDGRFIEVKIPWGSLEMDNEDTSQAILHDRLGTFLPYDISRFP